MSDGSRDTPWRQGDFFDLSTEGEEAFKGVIASHDCDLCASPATEPFVECILAEDVDKVDGQFSFGKNPRRIQCAVTGAAGDAAVQLHIHNRRSFRKEHFMAEAKPSGRTMTEPDRRIFRAWLAARYSRSAFPNRFEDRLTPRLRKRIEKLSSERGRDIRALFFDLDDGEMVEREVGDTYTLEIWVVYEGQVADPVASEAFAHDLAIIFKDEYLNLENEEWCDIQLLACHPVSTNEFPLELANSMKTWRVDHRSFEQLPNGVHPEPNR